MTALYTSKIIFICIVYYTSLNDRKCIYFYVFAFFQALVVFAVCLPLYKMALLLLLGLLTVCAATPRGKKKKKQLY